MSFGPRLRLARQRAAISKSAVESGPPETAKIRVDVVARSARSVLASAAEREGVSAVGTLVFPLDALLHADRGARIFTSDFVQGRTSGILFAQGRQRLTKPQHRVGRLGRSLEF